MIKVTISLLMALFFVTTPAKSNTNPVDSSIVVKTNAEDLKAIESDLIQLAMLEANPHHQKITPNWKIGDGLNYNISVKGISIGTMTWKLDAETQSKFLITQTITMFKKSLATEILYDKITGDFVGIRFGGVQIPLPAKGDEIISRGEEQLVVEAGTYNATYLKTEDGKKLQKEAWINTAELPLKGWLKLKTTYKKLDLTLELESFAKVK